jgi:hypothetical protein
MLAKEEDFIARFGARVSHAAQVQSRIKKLEKIERIQLPPEQRTIKFEFTEPPRSGDDVARLDNLGQGLAATGRNEATGVQRPGGHDPAAGENRSHRSQRGRQIDPAQSAGRPGGADHRRRRARRQCPHRLFQPALHGPARRRANSDRNRAGGHAPGQYRRGPQPLRRLSLSGR